MSTKKLCTLLRMILLSGSILALNGCQSITIKNRKPCFVNGELSLGATCANTVYDENSWQLTTQQTLDMLEARPEMPDPNDPTKKVPAHPPAVFQSADDYGEETTEIELACRLLGNKCGYELKKTVEHRKQMLESIKALPASDVQ